VVPILTYFAVALPEVDAVVVVVVAVVDAAAVDNKAEVEVVAVAVLVDAAAVDDVAVAVAAVEDGVAAVATVDAAAVMDETAAVDSNAAPGDFTAETGEAAVIKMAFSDAVFLTAPVVAILLVAVLTPPTAAEVSEFTSSPSVVELDACKAEC
jgi:hypothetical protein